MARAAHAKVSPIDLRCEYLTNPVGLGERRPRLSWRLQSEERGVRQEAFRIIVASSLDMLNRDEGDLWDSGRVVSDETVHRVYEGRPLVSRQVCHWKVQVWCQGQGGYVESEPALWEMGLLEREDWSAEWIGLRTGMDEPAPDLSENHWWWVGAAADEGENGPARAFFRRTFELPADVPVKSAWLLINADSVFRQYTNGLETARHTFFQQRMQWVDLKYHLQPGRNVLAIFVQRPSLPAGVVGRFEAVLEDGRTIRIDIDGTWKASPAAEAGWEGLDFDDAGWGAPVSVARYGDDPWQYQVVQPKPEPAPYLRKTFTVDGPVRRARLYATALGVYEPRLNGQRIGDVHFAPGWTDYNKRVQVQAYDVTDQLEQGENVLGAILGDGWYAGHVGMFGRHVYGPYPLGFLAQLEIEYEDGRTERVVTDASWQGRSGPIVVSDMLMGETYDARFELTGWDRPGFSASGWQSVQVLPPYEGSLDMQVDPAIRTTLQLPAVKKSSPAPGVTIFDLGQNMVGRVRLRVRGANPGQVITLRHGEMLKPDGTLYTLNLRSARNMDVYICKGGEEEWFEPHFTFHGFRYVEVRGYAVEPRLEDVVGQVIHSDTPIIGSFECAHPMINQLQSNIVWGQRGNFLSVPTDCPQRDERLGWTGDAQVFVRTASFNAQTASFFAKWMRDVTDAQHDSGAFTDIAPAPGLGGGTAAWGDAGVIVPWTVYLCYGDTRIIERSYPAMTRWIAYLQEHSDGLIRPAAGYGDWLSIDADTPKEVISTAYFAYSTALVAKMARLLGKDDNAEKYEKLFAEIREAFNKRFVDADGRIHGDTQTAYLVALRMNLLSEEKRNQALKHLAEDVRRRGNRLSTGFVGCSYLLPELTEGGELDLAYKLLTATHYPSWGYTIKLGATTMWERWDSVQEDGTFQDVGMNSFNHYAYGSVGEWLYRYVAGIEVEAEGAGYRTFLIQPNPGEEMPWARAQYESVRGPIAVDWRVEGDEFALDVEVPANTSATVHLPTSDPGSATEGGTPVGTAAASVPGVQYVGMEERFGRPRAVFEVASGRYSFRCRYS